MADRLPTCSPDTDAWPPVRHEHDAHAVEAFDFDGSGDALRTSLFLSIFGQVEADAPSSAD